MTYHDDAPHRANGFTLIELLVSLAILSLTAVLLLGGVITVGNVAARTRQQQIGGNDVAAAQIILRDRVTQLRPVARMDVRDPTMDVGGNDRIFDFYSKPPTGDPAGGIRKYRLMLTGTGDLVLFQAPELTDRFDLRSAGVQGWKASRLLTGVTSLSLAYFGTAQSDPVIRWRSFWQNQSSAPRLVRIRLGFAEGDSRTWPDLIIRPAATVDLTCNPEKQSSCGSGT